MFYHRDKKQLTHWLIAKLFSVISVKILALSKQRSLRWTPQAAQPVSQAVFPLPLTHPECLGHIFCSLDPQTPIWSPHSLACSRAASSMESLISSSRDDPFLRYSTTGTHLSYPAKYPSQALTATMAVLATMHHSSQCHWAPWSCRWPALLPGMAFAVQADSSINRVMLWLRAASWLHFHMFPN